MCAAPNEGLGGLRYRSLLLEPFPNKTTATSVGKQGKQRGQRHVSGLRGIIWGNLVERKIGGVREWDNHLFKCVRILIIAIVIPATFVPEPWGGSRVILVADSFTKWCRSRYIIQSREA